MKIFRSRTWIHLVNATAAMALIALLAGEAHSQNKATKKAKARKPILAKAEPGKAPAKPKASNTKTAKHSVPLAATLATSAKIDRLIDTNLKKHKIKPHGPISDEVFLRRIYLDVIGRIPTYQESNDFLGSKAKDKRAKLIDQLLLSEGHASTSFNFWADVLRAQTRTRGSPVIGTSYVAWLKQAMRDNMPYDKFVYAMLTAEGHPVDNGASGYYLRDDGMPLDNMSNTVRVFLGTRLECAQCHDHPFDKWTQREFYEMAAYTYGIRTRNNDPAYRKLYKAATKPSVSNDARQALRNMVRPLRYEVSENPHRQLRLPKDYQYKDAKPGAVVKPLTIFGAQAKVKDPKQRLDAYGKWMTGSENPRFTLVVANRLWKRVMGVGLIEPIDDIRDETKASNPELMTTLNQLMVDAKYDMRQYLRVLYNTKAYQRQAHNEDIFPGEAFHYPGPVLRRMSAEELWDSMLTLVIPDPEQRKGSVQGRYGAEYVKTMRTNLKYKSPDEIIAQAEEFGKARTSRTARQQKLKTLREQQAKARARGNTKEMQRINAEMRALYKQNTASSESRKGQMAMMGSYLGSRKESDPRYKDFPRDLVRASELPAPANPGHFLRQFGQSDRQTIDASNTDATTTQILTLLNGPVYYQLARSNSVLRKNIDAAKTPAEKVRVIFMSILSRKPNSAELSMSLAALKANPKTGYQDVVWALLNTRQFAFVQ